MNMTSPYLLALGANLCFSTASLVFSHYARRFSPWWINQLKVFISLVLFGICTLLVGSVPLSLTAITLLVISGFIGLCIGDLFLFRAYATLGPARSLVLFSFQPLLLGVYGWFFLGQHLSLWQFIAVACMIICLGVFVLERNRLTGHWDWKSFFWAFAGITLDAVGVMLTREAYEGNPELEAMQVNFIRCCGALGGYLMFQPKGLMQVGHDLYQMHFKERSLVVIACIAGTFVSLALYLSALKYAHVASLTALAITGPVWVSILECLWQKRWPNGYLITAFGFFLLGFYFMTS